MCRHLTGREVGHGHVPVGDLAVAVDALDQRFDLVHARRLLGDGRGLLLADPVRWVARREAQDDGVQLGQCDAKSTLTKKNKTIHAHS